jgi:hypothetical protein
LGHVAKQSVDQPPGLEQVADRTQGFDGIEINRGTIPSAQLGVEIGPFGWNESARVVRQNQQKIKPAAPMTAAQELQGLPLERVAFTHNNDSVWKVFEMGSVWWLPSTGSITTG